MLSILNMFTYYLSIECVILSFSHWFGGSDAQNIAYTASSAKKSQQQQTIDTNVLAAYVIICTLAPSWLLKATNPLQYNIGTQTFLGVVTHRHQLQN